MGRLTKKHEPKRPSGTSLMGRVDAEISARGLTFKSAAAAIGVGVQTLQNHLSGEHVRSDSARKYENWLAGRVESRNVFILPTRQSEDPSDVESPPPPAPDQPRLVVDIFSGCGGLSLGFDLYGDQRQFRTILAIDNQAAPVAVLNRNARLMGHVGGDVGRRMDLTEFMNEAEFLAFYIGHVVAVSDDEALERDLNRLGGGALPVFQDAIAAADQAYVEALNTIRESVSWRKAYERLDRQSLNQTSVAGFHDKLRLPKPSLRPVSMPGVLWGGQDGRPKLKPLALHRSDLQLAAMEWDHEVSNLANKREATGKGQLTASARRVGAFVAFLETPAVAEVRDAWITWRAQRVVLRTQLFENETFTRELRALYTARCPVSVLVGGPPCQGFSRIGRGKLRSLREAQVQVHGDAEAGDSRNLLFQQYVMVLEALRPDVFLFENVQHFQSTVKVDGAEFQATEVLAEAIANMSEGEISYQVSSRILDASRFGVPQTRQRYFMAGVIETQASVEKQEAESCLALRRLPEAQLALALAGLSRPDVVGGETTGGGAMSSQAAALTLGDHPFTRWIRQPQPGRTEAPRAVDGHAARAARADDAAFFALMGPGKRWMDYRADESETVRALGSLLDALIALPDAGLSAATKAATRAGESLPDRDELMMLRERINGSLPLRLLLEQASEKLGAPHHLLTESYLAKRDGHHGDWIARMDASRPAKTMVSHMGKDTYAYVHPSDPRTISVREAARVQSFPDWFSLDGAALTDAFKMIGNAVPPLLSHGIADRVARVLAAREALVQHGGRRRAPV